MSVASISPYETKGGKRYRVRYRRPDGRQTDKWGFRTKREAQAFAATVEVSKLRGEYVAPSLGKATVGELVTAWLERKEATTRTSYYRTLPSAWKNHVAPTWERVAVAKVDRLDVEEWVAEMRSAELSATVVKRAHGVLCGILDDAVKTGRISVNPARGLDRGTLPRKTGRRRVYLTAEDVARLAAECGEHETLILTLAYTGIRPGEAVALKVGDVDFERRRLQIHSNAVELGNTFDVGPTKTYHRRSVPVPEFVLDRIKAESSDKGREDLVFPGSDGGYLRQPKTGSGWLEAAVKRAEVERVTLYSLRHTFASLAHSSRASVLAVSRSMGHKSAAMTLDQYSDLFDSDLDAVGTAMNTLGMGLDPEQ